MLPDSRVHTLQKVCFIQTETPRPIALLNPSPGPLSHLSRALKSRRSPQLANIVGTGARLAEEEGGGGGGGGEVG
jgi:hypothetical protein